MKRKKRILLYAVILVLAGVLVLGATGLPLPIGKRILPIYGYRRIVDQRADGSEIKTVIRYYPATMTVTSKKDGVLFGFTELNKVTHIFKTYTITIDTTTGKETWELVREENMEDYVASRLIPGNTQ